MMKSHMECSSNPIGSHANNNSNNAIPVVRCPNPRSASRPALLAANAPAAPASPNNPITLWLNESGEELIGKTIEDHKILKSEKMKKARRPRILNRGFVRIDLLWSGVLPCTSSYLADVLYRV